MIWRSPYLQEPQKEKKNYYTFFLKKEQEKKRKPFIAQKLKN